MQADPGRMFAPTVSSVTKIGDFLYAVVCGDRGYMVNMMPEPWRSWGPVRSREEAEKIALFCEENPQEADEMLSAFPMARVTAEYDPNDPNAALPVFPWVQDALLAAVTNLIATGEQPGAGDPVEDMLRRLPLAIAERLRSRRKHNRHPHSLHFTVAAVLRAHTLARTLGSSTEAAKAAVKELQGDFPNPLSRCSSETVRQYL